MVIDYVNMPNGVRKLPKDLNEELLGSMEKLNRTMERVGIDLKNSDRQSKKELKESNDILKEFEKFIKKNGDLSEDLSKSTRDFAQEFTKEWGHTYGKNINENTQKELNSIARNLLELQKDAKEVYGKGFQSTSKYREELNALRIESISKLKSAKKEDEKKSKENSTLSKKYAKESETEKTLEDIKEKMDLLTDEAFTKYGANFEQNEDYIKEMSALLKQSRQDYFESYLSDENKRYENSRISDNKYREDTHKEETNRSIIQNIQKLNQEAFAKYGADFELNEDYQKNYRALIKQSTEERLSAKKKDWDARDDLFHDSVDKIKEVIVDQKKSLLGVLGPLNLIISPMQEFFGGSLTKYLFGKIKKKVSTNITEKQVAKLEDGEGYLYLGNKLDQLSLPNNDVNSMNLLPSPDSNEILPSIKTNEISSLINSNEIETSNNTKKIPKKLKPKDTDMLKLGAVGLVGLYIGEFLKNEHDNGKEDGSDLKKIGKLGKLGKFAIKGLGIGAIITSVVMIIIDGISGMFKKEWGGNKASRFAAGALAGTGKGAKNAFKNGGKWALMGAGIGTLIAPGLGTLIGGAIGLILGGILGAIGGEKLNKAFIKMGEWFKKYVIQPIQNIINWFKEKLIDPMKDIWGDDGSFLDKLGDTMKLILEPIKDLFVKIGDSIKNCWNIVKNYTHEHLIEPISNFFSKIGESIKNAFNTVADFIDRHFVSPIKNFFTNIGEFINFIGSLDWIHHPIQSAKSVVTYLGKDPDDIEIDDVNITEETSSKKKSNKHDAILQSNGNPQYLIRGNERIELDPQDNILATTNFIGESKDFKRGELNPLINNVSPKSNLLSKVSKTEFSKVEQEIKRQNAISNKINNVSNVINNNSSVEKSNYKNQLGDIVELLSKILDESKNKIQMPSLTRNDLMQVVGGYF